MTATAVKHALEEVCSPEKAKASAWFFKTGKGQYGEGDRFIGVTVPEQRKVARKYKTLPISESEKLLKSPIHEHRLTALFILVGQYQRASKQQVASSEQGREEAQKAIIDCYLNNLDHVNNWDLVDSSAPYILGDWMLTHSRRALPSWAKSKNVWRRRIAMLTCGGFIRVGEFDDALKIAELLVHDSHDLIQKAVGWMLREIGNRDHATECAFLDRFAATMPRTMLRYSIEKFSADERVHYLSLDKTTS